MFSFTRLTFFFAELGSLLGYLFPWTVRETQVDFHKDTCFPVLPGLMEVKEQPDYSSHRPLAEGKLTLRLQLYFILNDRKGGEIPAIFHVLLKCWFRWFFFHTCNWKTNNCPLSTQGEVSYYRMIFKCVLLSCYIQLCSFKSSFSTWLLSFKLPIVWASWFQLLPMFFVGHVFYFFSYSTFSL